MERTVKLLTALAGLGCVALGSLAAHMGLESAAADALSRASLYGLVHAVAIIAILGWPGRGAAFVRLCWLGGIILFAGGIALKYLAGIALAGHAAPIGGTLLMLGWLILAVSRR